ncbi:MAG: bifunctional hydroxymethylpyrimidine kinase/phosphomethylpyrimidine kinase [Verrucomicrobiia bacterium]
MAKYQQIPVAATIAGSDSGGGAGIQADLKTFTALGVHGATIITCVTAQNPEEVRAVQEINPAIVVKQLEAVFEVLKPKAAKTGMLYSNRIIDVVSDYLSNIKNCPLVVDPVMVSTSGARLLKERAISALEKKLFPVATLITPNLDEASVLLNRGITTLEDFINSAKALYERYGRPILLKGGHLKEASKAFDFFYDGRQELLFSSQRVKNINTHGTGCSFSAAITAGLALNLKIEKAIKYAKDYITGSIRHSHIIGNYTTLNHNWILKRRYRFK